MDQQKIELLQLITDEQFQDTLFFIQGLLDDPDFTKSFESEVDEMRKFITFCFTSKHPSESQAFKDFFDFTIENSFLIQEFLISSTVLDSRQTEISEKFNFFVISHHLREAGFIVPKFDKNEWLKEYSEMLEKFESVTQLFPKQSQSIPEKSSKKIVFSIEEYMKKVRKFVLKDTLLHPKIYEEFMLENEVYFRKLVSFISQTEIYKDSPETVAFVSHTLIADLVGVGYFDKPLRLLISEERVKTIMDSLSNKKNIKIYSIFTLLISYGHLYDWFENLETSQQLRYVPEIKESLMLFSARLNGMLYVEDAIRESFQDIKAHFDKIFQEFQDPSSN